MSLSSEAKVGAMVLGTAILALAFAWLVGVENPFRSTTTLYVTYNFAGGIEVGSPVRVSGIKVGKVEKIEFFVPRKNQQVALKDAASADPLLPDSEVPLRLKLSIINEAARGIKQDSRFYVNMAGIIGERYIEVTPGSTQAARVMDGAEVAGVDPPRLDQLISQSFSLAGKIIDMIEKNEGDISKSIELLYKTVVAIDNSKMFRADIGSLINNFVDISGELKTITDKIQSPDGQRTLQLMYDLIWRLEPMNRKNVREFLQEEGIRARIF